MIKHLALAAACVSLLACGTESSETGSVVPEKYADEVSQVHVVSDMLARSENGRVVLDLRNSEDGFFIERGVDASAVDVICPSNRVMNLEQWRPELASEFQVAPAELEKDLFLYSPSSRIDADNNLIPVCADGCYLHREANNQWVCIC
jgi:hypothetical protein